MTRPAPLVALDLAEARALVHIGTRALLRSTDEADLVARLAALVLLAERHRHPRPKEA
ncbi:MAG: hypothetical protein U0P45_17210 [Acidimicrobiales bacterium]